MTRAISALVLTVLAVFAITAPAHAGSTEQLKLNFAGRDRTYYLYTPDAKPGLHPMLILLHGSGSNGLALLQLWQPVADREGIELLAPDSLQTEIGWDLHADGPDYIHNVIAAAAPTHSIDPHRLYLFGQSGGAVYALILGCMESNYFAAVAIHAGGWRNTAEYQTARYAKRAIPYSITVGDQDEFFALDGVRNTQKILIDHGVPTELNVLPGRHHTIRDVPPDYFDGVWAFLKDKTLPDLPSYTAYRDPAAAKGPDNDSGMSSGMMSR